MKKCTKCGIEKPATTEFFRKAKQQKSGLRPDCKACQAEFWKMNYPSIAVKHRKRTKLYAEMNQKKVKSARRRYYVRNKDRLTEYTKQWALKNKFLRKVNHKFSKAKHNAIKYGVKSTLTYEQVKNLFSGKDGICSYCKNRFLLLDLTIDHIIPMSKGGPNSINNICIACYSCNSTKGNQTVEKFKAYMGFK